MTSWRTALIGSRCARAELHHRSPRSIRCLKEKAPPSPADSNSANENNPLNHSTGTGTAFVTIDQALNTMEVQVTFSGLTAPTSAAHIHCCELMPGANLNVMVATVMPAFPGFPLGVTAGT